MKVLYLLDSVEPGGAEILALDVCRNAARFGIDLTVVVTNSGKLEKDFQTSGAEFVRLERNFPIDPILVKNLRKIIKAKKIEIVQGSQAVEGLHLYLAALGLNVKKVLGIHGFIPGRKNQMTANFLIPRMDANIYVGKEFHSSTAGNSHLIYNGVDTKRLIPRGKSIKNEIGIVENSFLLGMVANFPPDATKDQMTICRALPKVFAETKNTHFIFVGKAAKGGEKKFEECVEFCKQTKIINRVHFLGSRGDIPDVLDSLDIFVFSSMREGLPIAVIEAMLTSTPLIVSDIAPLLEVTDNGKCAEIFKTGDAEELAAKIIKLINNKELRENSAEKAKRFAEENFSIVAHLDSLTALYSNLLKRN